MDLSRSLTEIEGKDWGAPGIGGTSLIDHCLALRRKPLRGLNEDNLNDAVMQKITLSILIPLALEKLAANPWVESSIYEGDLLINVLKVGPAFWLQNEKLWAQTRKVVEEAIPSMENLDQAWQDVIRPVFESAWQNYLRARPPG